VADTKISDLTAASALTGTEEIPLSDGSATTKAATATQIKTWCNLAPVFDAGSASANSKPKLTSGTLLGTTEAGAIEFANGVPYFTPVVGDRGVIPAMLFKVLSADATGSDTINAQPWFPSAGGVSVRASTSYFFEGWLWISRAAGAVSHTTSLLFGGTATLTDITVFAGAKEGETTGFADFDMAVANAATALQVKGASTTTTEQILAFVKGIVRINAAGTLIPQFKYSAAPGGAPTVKEGSFFLLYPIGTNTVTEAGTWA
jgi:hypothetical protein